VQYRVYDFFQAFPNGLLSPSGSLEVVPQAPYPLPLKVAWIIAFQRNMA